ncbi:MAG: Uncharacterized conserved protein, DUF58 family, contains vWF domain [Verrucomicrobia bacterium]|nr:MAG: Uncharacterized conserved protein, DUF58 family, contains vWF domain [Verrucomicrobiota bacterium]
MAEPSQSSSHSFLDPEILGRLSTIPFDARRGMIGSVSGRHRSPVKGSSLEFAQYRKYVPGDDLRRMDWRAWGRSDRYYIKEFEADTNLRLCLVVDTSGSMNYQAGSIVKLEYARQLAGTLGFLAARQGDAVGLYCAAEGFQKEVPPKRGGAHLKVVLDELAAVKAAGTTGLVTALHEAAEKIKSRALVVIISDLFVEPETLKEAFQHLRFRKHDVAVFHLLEEREIRFDFDRPTRFVDLEGNAALVVDPSLAGRRYRDAMHRYLDEITGIVRDAGVDYHRVVVEEKYDEVLARFLLGRHTGLKTRR